MKNFIQTFLLIFVFSASVVNGFSTSSTYAFYNEPIDVVIPSTDKDIDTLNMCIEGIRKNCAQVRRIIVVSAKHLSNKAEWINEASFPFKKADISWHLLKGNGEAAKQFLEKPQSRVGWYYQQLLKFYAPYVISGISSNVLILDSDTIFLRPITFIDGSNAGLYNTGTEYHTPYFEHAKRFLPGMVRLYKDHSGICHHMLFQRAVLDDLFASVEEYHHMPFWQAFCRCVDNKELPGSGASEYEIYFNFVFSKTNQVHIRSLKWANINQLDLIKEYKTKGYDYVSCHAWSR